MSVVLVTSHESEERTLSIQERFWVKTERRCCVDAAKEDSQIGGKGGGGKKGQELIKTAVRVGQQTERQSLPSRTLGFQQANELLATGGIGARLPRVGMALESARAGNAAARNTLSSNLASLGLLDTPYGASALAQADQAAGLNETGVLTGESDKALSQLAQILNLGPVVAAPFAGGTSAAITTGNQPVDNSGLYAGIGSLLGSLAGNTTYSKDAGWGMGVSKG